MPPGDEDATEGKQKIEQRGGEQFTPAMGAVPTCAFTITRHQVKVTGPQLGLAVRAEKVFEAHVHIVCGSQQSKTVIQLVAVVVSACQS